jgi:hypothetical protein
MPDALRNQMFHEGDWVQVTGPLAESYIDMIGVIRAISQAGTIFRYFVEFENGISDKFFAFELRSAGKQSATA